MHFRGENWDLIKWLLKMIYSFYCVNFGMQCCNNTKCVGMYLNSISAFLSIEKFKQQCFNLASTLNRTSKLKNIEFDTGKSLSEALLFAEHGENMLCTKIVLNVRNNFCTQHVPRFELGIFMYWTCNSMNSLSSYCGLVDAKLELLTKIYL